MEVGEVVGDCQGRGLVQVLVALGLRQRADVGLALLGGEIFGIGLALVTGIGRVHHQERST